jgi:serine/threonine-protein kinase
MGFTHQRFTFDTMEGLDLRRAPAAFAHDDDDALRGGREDVVTTQNASSYRASAAAASKGRGLKVPVRCVAASSARTGSASCGTPSARSVAGSPPADRRSSRRPARRRPGCPLPSDSEFPKWDSTLVAVQSLETGARKVLIRGGSAARYVPTGHLVYMRAGTLMSVPFDLAHLDVTGSPVPLIGNVMQVTHAEAVLANSGAGQFSLSASGTLAYLPGRQHPDADRTLVWVERHGKEAPLPGPSRPYLIPRISPDGQRIAYWTMSAAGQDIWIYDLVRGSHTRLTHDGVHAMAIWSPDGKRLATRVGTRMRHRLEVLAADGSRGVERLGSDERSGHPHAWAPDGSAVAFQDDAAGPVDVWVQPTTGDRQARLVARGSASVEFSPDGRWLAYVSPESGRPEVYVQPDPGPGPRHVVSTDGGIQPAWSPDGHELFYTSDRPDGRRLIKLMAVPVTIGAAFKAGVPRLLFEGRYNGAGTWRYYDVAPDGKRFLMVQNVDRPPLKPTQMVLVQNWVEELKRKVPVK